MKTLLITEQELKVLMTAISKHKKDLDILEDIFNPQITIEIKTIDSFLKRNDI